MTPPRMDEGIVTARLTGLQQSLDQLGTLQGVTATDLESDPMMRAAAERLIQVIVDFAIDINSHICVTKVGRAPETGRESFHGAADAGVIDRGLADALGPCAGLRNVLIHRYAQIQCELVAGSIEEILDRFPAYIDQVAAFVRESSEEQS